MHTAPFRLMPTRLLSTMDVNQSTPAESRLLLELDPRYTAAVLDALRYRDCEPLKALFIEYGVPWVDEDFEL